MKKISTVRPQRRGRSRRPRLSVPAVKQSPNAEEGTSAKSQSSLAVEEPYGELFDLAPIAFYTLDRRARICELNATGAQFLGFPPAWLIGRSFVVFVAKSHLQRFLDSLREPIRDSETRTIEIDLIVENRRQPVQISLTTSVAGSSVFHRLIVIDRTEVENTEKLLQAALANWRSLVHSAPDTIMTVETGGRISFINKPIWGYSATALVGTSILDYIGDLEKPKLQKCLDEAFRRGKRTACEISGINGDWAKWYQLSFGSPHSYRLNRGRGLTTTTVVIREISENKRTEETLRVSGEQMRDFAARLEAVREEERTRVAREIHDELGQALTVLKLDLSWLRSRTSRSSESQKRLKSMIRHVDDTLETVRRIASELRPSVLDNLGLIPAIEWQVSEFRKRTQIRTELLSNANSLDISMEGSVAVFRAVQEALTNIMRHAKASRVQVRLDLSDYALRISISDNGIGMSQTEQGEFNSLGIVGMKERISRIGGDFRLLSEPGKGTRLEIIVPLLQD
jgi:PAS domain S-box-containing protein